MDLAGHEKFTKTIILIANKEADIEKDIIQVEKMWNEKTFTIYEHNEYGYILGSTNEINEQLDTNILNMQKQVVSQFIGPFLDPVKKWIKLMTIMINVVEIWMKCQKRWLKLEGIFRKTDLKQSFPKITDRFNALSKLYKEIMYKTAKRRNVLECCMENEKYEKIEKILLNIEICEKSLNDYMYEKRIICPRFYFLSDDELLHTLCTYDPTNMYESIRKIMSTFSKFHYKKNNQNQTNIIAIVSSEKELLQFVNPILIEKQIENWINNVLIEMKKSIKFLIGETMKQIKKISISLLKQLPSLLGMIISVINSIQWTAMIENSFHNISNGNTNLLNECLTNISTNVKELISYVQTHSTLHTDKNKIDGLLISNIHFRDILHNLILYKVTNSEDFEWQKHLRFYWLDENNSIEIRQCHNSFEYGYEFKDSSNKVVITPVTERVILSLTQAVSTKLGGALQGSTQTGKTAIIEDLSNTFCYFCFVINCGKHFNYYSMKNTLQGIIQCGVWACFDEFDRIDSNYLSILSSQLQFIYLAIKSKCQYLYFYGQNVKLDHKLSIFITMNFTSMHRYNLPATIKNLFRLTTCMIPDTEYICEIKLLTFGFIEYKALAKKIVTFNKLATRQFSKQRHYDFGLKTTHIVLEIANNIKQSITDTTEDAVIVGALRNVNLNKLVPEDVSLFLGLLKDLFPSSHCLKIEYSAFKKMAINILSQQKYVILNEQIEKIIQLHQTLKFNSSTMILGPTSCGKSVIVDAFCKTQSELEKSTKLHVLNPKAYSIDHLFGYYNTLSNDWNNGLFNSIFYTINEELYNQTNDFHYILFDGEVDPIWIEYLHCVMDSKMLITANQKTIHMQENCRLLYEVGNVSYACPTTISKTSIIYVNSGISDYQLYFDRWINDKLKDEKDCLTRLRKKYVDNGVKFILGISNKSTFQPLNMVISQTSVNMVTQLCYVIDAMYSYEQETNYSIAEENSHNGNEGNDCSLDEFLEAVFIQACYFSLGASLTEQSRTKFDDFIKRTSGFTKVYDSQEKPATRREIPISFPTLYDYIFDVKKKIWTSLKQLIPNYVYENNKCFNNILIPTVDKIRTIQFLDLMTKVQRPVILIGETGISKSAMVKEFLQNLNPDKFNTLFVNFSLRTTSIHIQKNIDSIIERRALNIYGPAAGKRLIVFIDDMQMPFVDIYGSQQPIALLKLMIEREGLYDLEHDFNWRNLIDISYLAIATLIKGDKFTVDPRFVSLTSVYYITVPSDETINYIYTTILTGHVQTFAPKIQELTKNIVHITIDIYKMIIEKLLPIPWKFHYIFNMRDLSKIFAGICQSDAKFYQNEKQFIRLWRNEFCRSICDGINNENVNLAYNYHLNDLKIIEEHIEKAVKDKWYQTEVLNYVFREPLLFGDFRNVCKKKRSRFYEDLLDFEAIRSLFSEILESYNSKNENDKIDIILFDYVLENLSKVQRILRLHRGHMLIVGMNGIGKASVVKLASFAAECEIFKITINRDFNEMSFREELKRLFHIAGVNNKNVVFFFADSHITDENLLELVNNLLTTGTVSTLFNDEEKNIIIRNNKHATEECNIIKENVWLKFEERCVNNLHIVLSMNALNQNFPKYCRMYPSFINNTTINWMAPWPKEAFVSIADIIMKKNTTIPKDYRMKIVEHFIHIYNSMEDYVSRHFMKYSRFNHISPKQYIDSLKLYLTILDKKRNELSGQLNHLSGGLNKIAEIINISENLSLNLRNKKEKIGELTTNCKTLVKYIQENQEIFVDIKNQCQQKTKQISSQSEMIKKEQNEISESLLVAQNKLSAAKEDIGNLNESDIENISSYENPPETVQIICECIALISGSDDISWSGLKDTIDDAGFLLSLKEINCDLINKKKQLAIKERIEKINDVNQIEKISKPAYEFYKFILSVIDYCVVYKDVKTRTNKLKSLQTDTENLDKNMKNDEIQLKLTEKKLSEANVKYTINLDERDKIEKEMEYLKKRITVLDELIDALSSENLRWKNESRDLEINIVNLYGNCLICAGFLIYCAPFMYEFRNEMIYDNWQKSVLEKEIPISQPFRIENQLSNDLEMCKWFSEGLPSDELSLQNTILMLKSLKVPLCIDPQFQAFTWIKKIESNSLKICSSNAKNFIQLLEFTIINGFSLIVQNIDFIDPIFNNLFSMNIQNDLTKRICIINGKRIPYHPNFRLYLLTNSSNPNFDSSLFVKTTIIDYTMTKHNLEEELLSIILQHERVDIENAKEKVLLEIHEKQIVLQELEDELLKQIISIEDNITSQTDVIPTLDNIKGRASEVITKLCVAETMSKDINELRNNFRSVAERGSILFFALLNMTFVNSLYQFSLDNYLIIFKRSLNKAIKDDVLSHRLQNIINVLTKNIYDYACLSLYDKDKLLFSFEICIKIEENAGHIFQNQIDFFCRGSDLEDDIELPEEMNWLSLSNWKDISKLKEDFADKFAELYEDILNEPLKWKKWFESGEPESHLPLKYFKTLSPFEELMLMRCFHVDRICHGIMNYVSRIMGEYYIIPSNNTLDIIYGYSISTQPIVLILNCGSDLTSALIQLGEKYTKNKANVKYLSLAKSQESTAINFIKDAAINGKWLILQNCDVLLSFISQLKTILAELNKPNSNFRLWLMSSPTNDFPLQILRHSLKAIIEPPNGLKLKMKNVYCNFQTNDLEDCLHPAYKHLVYVVAFYHSVLQERNKYDKIGWNVIYDFNESDLEDSKTILQNYLTECLTLKKESIPWTNLKYLIGEVIYGGKIIDSFDYRISMIYLNEYFGDVVFDSYQPYHFYRDEMFEYVLPTEGDLNFCINLIETFPYVNSSEVIGLHTNADVCYYTQRSNNFLQNLNNLYSQTTIKKSMFNHFDFVNDLCTTILQKMPMEYNLERIKSNFGLNITPLTKVLFQELTIINMLIHKIKVTLNRLKQAISGKIPMNFNLEQLMYSLDKGILPQEWIKFAPETNKNLSDWLNHFEKRIIQYTHWAGVNEPIVIWLSGLHYPETYLTAVTQMGCRKNNWRLENVFFTTDVTKFINEEEIEERLEQGCYIKGLYVNGARWNIMENCLVQSYYRVMTEELPILEINITDIDQETSECTITTPVYTTRNRRSIKGDGLIFEANLKIKENLSYWILQNVCLLLNVE